MLNHQTEVKTFAPWRSSLAFVLGTLLNGQKFVYVLPAQQLLSGGLTRQPPAAPSPTPSPCVNPYLANQFCLLSGTRPQTFRSLAPQLTGDEEPPSRARHAKSIPGEARVAAGVRLAHVGKSQRPVGGERDPAGRVIIHHPLTLTLFYIIIRAVMIQCFLSQYDTDI